jgi:hypothetical protein
MPLDPCARPASSTPALPCPGMSGFTLRWSADNAACGPGLRGVGPSWGHRSGSLSNCVHGALVRAAPSALRLRDPLGKLAVASTQLLDLGPRRQPGHAAAAPGPRAAESLCTFHEPAQLERPAADPHDQIHIRATSPPQPQLEDGDRHRRGFHRQRRKRVRRKPVPAARRQVGGAQPALDVRVQAVHLLVGIRPPPLYLLDPAGQHATAASRSGSTRPTLPTHSVFPFTTQNTLRPSPPATRCRPPTATTFGRTGVP